MKTNNSFGLYSLFLRRLSEVNNQRIIPFPVAFEKLCRNFSIKKEECFKILRYLRDLGVIDIIFGNGIIINNVKNISVEEKISTLNLNTKLNFNRR